MGKFLLGVFKWTLLILGVVVFGLGALLATVVAFLLPFAIPLVPFYLVAQATNNWWLGAIVGVVLVVVEVAIGLAAIVQLFLKFAGVTRRLTVRAIAEMKEELK